jgi:hypothetical protein
MNRHHLLSLLYPLYLLSLILLLLWFNMRLRFSRSLLLYSFAALATEAGISQDVYDKMAPAFNKLKDNMQSVYKTEEHMARVKQSKELGIELNEITIAGLSEEESS